jgi:hypothetical protein
MKTLSAFLITAFTLVPTLMRSEEKIDYQRLNTDVVILGRLGVPLGKVVEIEASVIDGSSLGTKSTDGRYLLGVTKVGATVSKDSIICDFRLCPGSDAKLANNDFSLYELKTGKEAGSLTGEEIENLKRDYVGRTYHLLVYELGTFRGIPKNLPLELTWQDTGFGFYTSLIVLKAAEHNSKPNQ